jgi:SAM-dependent methyltransferase
VSSGLIAFRDPVVLVMRKLRYGVVHVRPPQQRVIDYYRRPESRVTYALLLGGTRHFGWYPPGSERLPMRTAMRLMEDRLGRAAVALHLAAAFGLRVDGVDIVAADVRGAAHRAARHRGPGRARFHVMDYQRLGFADGSFDGAYTMETLVHAPDPAAVLRELHRVLAAGGRLALFEYSMAPREALTARQRRLFDAITEESAMHALPGFVHGCFPGLLHAAGFRDVQVEDVTGRMAPMLRRLARLLWLPYQLARAAGVQRRLVNAMAAVEADRHRGVWRYNVVTAAKPYSSATV